MNKNTDTKTASAQPENARKYKKGKFGLQFFGQDTAHVTPGVAQADAQSEASERMAAAGAQPENVRIIIELEGGVIQNILGIPKGVTVQVNDYDTEGADMEELTTLEDGSEVYMSEWEGGK